MKSRDGFSQLIARLTPRGAARTGPAPVTSVSMAPIVLLTGAAGGIASLIRPALADLAQNVRLSDLRKVEPHTHNESFVRARLESGRQIEKAVRGCNAIVHLGGIAKEAPWDTVMKANLLGTINIFEAARRHGVRRVVFASTMHTMGFYGREENFTEDSPARPDSRYAVSKLWTEAVGQLFAEKYGMSVTCLRIGHATDRLEHAEPGNWIGADDLVALIRLGLERAAPGFVLVHGVVNYSGCSISDDRLQRQFKFAFGANGGAYDDALRRLPAWYPNDSLALKWRGGGFASGAKNMLRAGNHRDQ